MKKMQILIAYCSKTGNTEKVAHSLKEGFKGYHVDLLHIKNDIPEVDFNSYDFILFGSGLYKKNKPCHDLVDFIRKNIKTPIIYGLFCTHSNLDFNDLEFDLLDKILQRKKSYKIDIFECLGDLNVSSEEERMKLLENIFHNNLEKSQKIIRGCPSAQALELAKDFASSFVGKVSYYIDEEFLWNKYVPKQGSAKTIQGELLRAIVRIRSEAIRNGNINWGDENYYSDLCDFMEKILCNSDVFNMKTKNEIQNAIKRLKKYEDPYIEEDLYDMIKKRIIDWYRVNKEPIYRKSSNKRSNEFIVNEFITLRLENDKTNIYVNNECFWQCKFLIQEIPIKEITSLDELESIDEVTEKLGSDRSVALPPETEFWGHCSNLQVWAENEYNTKLLNKNNAFPLLKKLKEAGDPIAKKVFKKEIIKRITNGYIPVIEFLSENGYLRYFYKEELKALATEWVERKGEKIPVFGKVLNLRDKGIRDLSEIKGLKEFKSLKRLDLSGNELINLPEFIGNLKSLQALILEKNQLTTLPESIGNLKSLRTLKLNNNQLKTLPESIGNLTSLKNLYLNKNKLTTLPKSIGNLKSLHELYLHQNQLITLPESIVKLFSLKELWLHGNQLTSIPEAIGNLKSLQTLNLYYNSLKILPRSIERLESLQVLYLDENELTSLPRSIINMISLKYLYISREKLDSETISMLEQLKNKGVEILK